MNSWTRGKTQKKQSNNRKQLKIVKKYEQVEERNDSSIVLYRDKKN
jgi:hypothetical protein